jgi:hypothetical protein
MSLDAGRAKTAGELLNRETDDRSEGPKSLAVSGGGVATTYMVAGTVPTRATQALLQICLNECGLPTPPVLKI